MFYLTNFNVSHIQDIPEWYSCYSTEVLSCIETTMGVTHYTLLQWVATLKPWSYCILYIHICLTRLTKMG